MRLLEVGIGFCCGYVVCSGFWLNFLGVGVFIMGFIVRGFVYVFLEDL